MAPDVAEIAAAVRSCPLVDCLHGGRHGRIATTGGGVRHVGVLVGGDSLVVGVIGRPGATMDEVAAQVRAVLSALAPGYQVTVSVRSARPLASD